MVELSSRLHRHKPEDIFDLVRLFPPGLSLDIGAAMGWAAKHLHNASPQGKVICFEPWEKNIPYFHQNVGNNSQISLIEKAVSDFNGRGLFFVPSMVNGDEHGGWSKYPGYSSTGMLIPQKDSSNISENCFEVNVCSLDYVIDEQVRFMKIDVQGGEGAVLKGASRLIENNLIDMIFVEFQGEEDVIEFAENHDFHLFDIEYNAIPSATDFSELGFKDGYRELPLSNGDMAIRGSIAGLPRSGKALCKFMDDWRREKVGHIWTDLLLVSNSFSTDFLSALDTLSLADLKS